MRDSRNLMRTTSLFWEARRDRSDEADFSPLFTLKNIDHMVDGVLYYSLKKIFLSYDHVSGLEYDFAMDVFGSWEHWQKLLKSSVRHEFTAWREELDIRNKATAIKQLIKASSLSGNTGVAASKYLADKGYLEKRIAGRPSKEEVERTRKEEAAVQKTLAEDMKRLGLAVVGKG